MANWAEFFTRLGSGLNDFASYKDRQKTADEERQFRNKELGFRQQEIADTQQYRSDTLQALERRRIQMAADAETDRLARQGVEASPSNILDTKKAALPETPGYDVAGMAINATRQYGQSRMKEFADAIPTAQNEMYQSGGISQPLPGGGRVFMPPGVRANLDIARANAETGRLNRANQVRIALIRANAITGRKSDQKERSRISYMQKEMDRLQRPQMDPDTGRYTLPGMKQSEAYRAAAQGWEKVKDLPDQEMLNFDPEPVRQQVEGLDDDTARSTLEAAGYTPDEADEVISGRPKPDDTLNPHPVGFGDEQ